jgi:hypothetical protein
MTPKCLRVSRLAHILDLFGEDSWRINVYAGQLEVRPPGAPAIGRTQPRWGYIFFGPPTQRFGAGPRQWY